MYAFEREIALSASLGKERDERRDWRSTSFCFSEARSNQEHSSLMATIAVVTPTTKRPKGFAAKAPFNAIIESLTASTAFFIPMTAAVKAVAVRIILPTPIIVLIV